MFAERASERESVWSERLEISRYTVVVWPKKILAETRCAAGCTAEGDDGGEFIRRRPGRPSTALSENLSEAAFSASASAVRIVVTPRVLLHRTFSPCGSVSSHGERALSRRLEISAGGFPSTLGDWLGPGAGGGSGRETTVEGKKFSGPASCAHVVGKGRVRKGA